MPQQGSGSALLAVGVFSTIATFRQCFYNSKLQLIIISQVLATYLTSGGWDLLNTWLTDTRKLDNIALAHEILKVLKHLPVTLDLLKQGNL